MMKLHVMLRSAVLIQLLLVSILASAEADDPRPTFLSNNALPSSPATEESLTDKRHTASSIRSGLPSSNRQRKGSEQLAHAKATKGVRGVRNFNFDSK